MKEQIQQLIAEGRTEDALDMLAKLSSDAILLQSRFNNGKKQYNMGLIEFSEWQRTQAQINYAALELANSTKTTAAPAGNASAGNNQSNQGGGQAEQPFKVFISYNHQDSFAMRSVKGFLEDHNVKVHVDINDMSVGESIQGFIDQAFKNNDFVLSIISRNSLLSGWVARELTVAQVLNKLNNNWIPISIDNSAFDNNFFFEANASIDLKITAQREQIKKALESDLDISAFTDELKRLQDLKASISSTIANLKSVLVIDINGPAFDSGMMKVVNKIRSRT